ncbi:MAG: hypothetical protein ACLRQF_24715 [Thomasclavelia ramosa]
MLSHCHPKENYYEDLIERIKIPAVSGDGTGIIQVNLFLDLMTP